MFKELLLVFLSVVCLFKETSALGSSCGGRQLGHSAQRDYWLAKLKHEELASFNPNPGSYKVFRNVKDFGAKGDGKTDDSNAINLAISEGNRCGPGCGSSTRAPAIVYFPPGQYVVTRPLLQFYFTQFIGDAQNLPTLIMDPSFKGGIGLIDSDEYLNGPNEIWTNQNNFYRQVRNFIIDTTRVPPDHSATGIHWQVAQATSITNVHFKMSKAAGNKHQGVWMENGSGGFMSDLTFDGGKFALWVGNQQFTSRNLTIHNADTAIYMNWNWGWTFKGIRIENCKTGIEMTAGGENNQGVGSFLLMDAEIVSTQVGIKTATSPTSKPAGAGALILDNVHFQGVNDGIKHTSGRVILAGGSKTIKSWGQGKFYKNGQGSFHQGDMPAPNKPATLLDGRGNFFEKSKPTYLDVALADFVSVKSEGAKGDGRTDDTHAIQQAITKYAGCKVIYIPAGDYIVTDTIYVPPGSRIIGEVWSVIMAKGSKFHDINNPKVVIEVGKPGETGVAEISEMLFSTQGAVPGAIMVQINMKDPAGQKGVVGLWDCHFRIGGASGTDLQSNNCGKGGAAGKAECMGAYMMLHIAATGSAYLENVWAWVSDHDLDGPTQVSIYNGRGILIESKEGPVWLYGTASEHSVMYQYNLANTKNVIMAMIQTETPYYQAYPPAPKPFSTVAKYHDPDYSHCAANSHTCPMAWGLRIVDSDDIFVYGAGLYNFFQNYNQDCLKSEHCQDNMLSIEKSRNVHIFNLNTKATDSMVNVDGNARVKQSDNRAGFCSTIASFSL